MSVTTLSVLLLEHDAADALLIEETLARTLPRTRVTRAATREEYLDRLESTPADLVLAHANVPGCEGIEAFHLARARHPRIAFVSISGADSDIDGRALRGLGISAVLPQGDLDGIGPAIEHALAPGPTGIDPARLLVGQDLLLAVGRELTRVTDRAALITLAQATALELTGAEHATLAMREGDDCHYLDEQHDSRLVPAEPVPAEPLWKGRRLPLGTCLSGWAMQQRCPAVVDDLDSDPRVPPMFRGVSVSSAVVVPVRSDQPIAALGVYFTDRQELDATAVWLLQALADSTAVALENLRQREHLAATATDRITELAALTYAVSHDLRAPIRHLEGFARILLQDVGDLDPQAQHGAQRIHDAAAHLREMVNGMLTLSRIAQVEVHPQPVDLADLAREVAQSLANAPASGPGPARAGVVEFVAPAHLPVTGDPRLLQTVMQDLLGNAWKFTSRIPQPRVELGVALPGSDLGGATLVPGPRSAPESERSPMYFVRDNGAGFDPAAADRLFGVFQRLHSGEDFPGTGVGLASVKRIVGKHGGTVQATAAPDEGATFYFTLPT